MKKFGLFIPCDSSMELRCIDGVWTRIDPRCYMPHIGNPQKVWDILSTIPGSPCDQRRAASAAKGCLTYCRIRATMFYGVPDDVDLYTEDFYYD